MGIYTFYTEYIPPIILLQTSLKNIHILMGKTLNTQTGLNGKTKEI